MQIVTRYIKATDTEGEKVVAKGGGRGFVQGWDYALNQTDNHAEVAAMVAQAPVTLVSETHGGYVFETVNEEDGHS